MEPELWAYDWSHHWFHYSFVSLCDPMGCSPPGSSVCGILQARILEWVAMSYSRDLPHPGIELASVTSALAGEFDFLAYDWFHYYLLILLLSLEKWTDVIISI